MYETMANIAEEVRQQILDGTLGDPVEEQDCPWHIDVRFPIWDEADFVNGELEKELGEYLRSHHGTWYEEDVKEDGRFELMANVLKSEFWEEVSHHRRPTFKVAMLVGVNLHMVVRAGDPNRPIPAPQAWDRLPDYSHLYCRGDTFEDCVRQFM